jgi:ribulose 1,5-bisphosphate synthetase/thiazole synthase
VSGGTAGGVVAAVKLARLGRSVLLLQPGRHLGGMTSGGLGWTDFGKKSVIGGMARQFYRDAGRAYDKEEEWLFEPHVAEEIMNRMVAAARVPVRFRQYLDRVAM